MTALMPGEPNASSDDDSLRRLASRMRHMFRDSLPVPHPFVYHRIPNKNIIRLFLLHPGYGDDPLEGELRYVPLKYVKPYDALSYTWGSANKPYNVYINSVNSVTTLAITASVHSALIRLRDPDIISTFWIDAICINQDDNEEKSMQVAVMSQIYSSAARVLCWLGHDPNASRNFQLLLQLSDTNFRRLPDMNVTREFMQSNNLPGKGDTRWRDMMLFFKNPWFRRGWILQEVYHGKEVLVLCGEEAVELKDILLGVEALIDHRLIGWGWGVAAKYNATEDLAGLTSFRTVLNLKACSTLGGMIHHEMNYFVNNDEGRQTWLRARMDRVPALSPMSGTVSAIRNSLQGTDVMMRYDPIVGRLMDQALQAYGIDDAVIRLPLHQLHRMYMFSTTTDPRDRYFALLSMSAERDVQSLQPDYSESLDLTHIRFARYFLLEQVDSTDGSQPKNLLISAGLANSPDSPTLPSWLPDTASNSNPMRLMTGMGVSHLYYHAAGETQVSYKPHPMSPSPSSPFQSILATGKTLSLISHILPQPFAVSQGLGASDVTSFFAACDLLPLTAYPDETHEDVVWRTLIVNIDTEFQHAPARYRELYRATRELWESGELERYEDELMERYDPAEFWNKWGQRWAVTAAVGKWEVCVTEGGMMGLVPKGTRVGDRVCVVEGENMPLLFREKKVQGEGEERFEVVGACYIHGIMRGEATGEGWVKEEFVLV